MEIDISYSSFNNQYLNAVKLHYKFSLAKEKTYRKNEVKTFPYENRQQDMQYINEAARENYLKRSEERRVGKECRSRQTAVVKKHEQKQTVSEHVSKGSGGK